MVSFYQKLQEVIGESQFLDKADNVYRTDEFIVKQELSLMTDKQGLTYLVSNDTFYPRDWMNDAEYIRIFRGCKKINGKRIHADTYIRKYVYR